MIFAKPTKEANNLGSVSATYSATGDMTYNKGTTDGQPTQQVPFSASGVDAILDPADALCMVQYNSTTDVMTVVSSDPDFYVFDLGVTNGQVTIGDINFHYTPQALDQAALSTIGNVDYIKESEIPHLIAELNGDVANFDGNDAVALLKNDVAIDTVGVIGTDPGTSWTVGSGSTQDHTLVRSASVTGPTTSWNTSEWDVYAQDTVTYVGSHTMTNPGTATDLFISEYGEGSSSNKWIEIYNGTGSDVDLSTYTLALYSDGSSTPTYTEPLIGTLASGDAYVVANSSASIQTLIDTETAMKFSYLNFGFEIDPGQYFDVNTDKTYVGDYHNNPNSYVFTFDNVNTNSTFITIYILNLSNYYSVYNNIIIYYGTTYVGTYQNYDIIEVDFDSSNQISVVPSVLS